MNHDTHIKLLQAIHKYYPIGSPYLKEWNSDLQSIVESKIKGNAESASSWQAIVQELRDKGLSVQNLSFLQFPNLMLTVEQSETIQSITIYKSFVICLSLLCPFYTFYYEYRHKVRIHSGLLPLSSLVFLSKEDLNSLKIFAHHKEFEDILRFHFPEHTFISHYDLMMRKIYGAIPFGSDPSSKINLESSVFELLFNNEQPNSILP